jgi:hypothetical protein
MAVAITAIDTLKLASAKKGVDAGEEQARKDGSHQQILTDHPEQGGDRIGRTGCRRPGELLIAQIHHQGSADQREERPNVNIRPSQEAIAPGHETCRDPLIRFSFFD